MKLQPEITPPSKATLKKYGLTEDEWWGILHRQGDVCPICEKVPTTGRFVIDHEHVRGWKNMPDSARKRYVRGITCWFDNHSFLGRGITVQKSENVTRYLIEHEARKDAYEDRR
jgi:hypothetical protein